MRPRDGIGGISVSSEKYDVIIVGAGNAALCAAIAATEGGAKVLVLEKANEDERGGNSLFTAGGFRFVHNGIEDVQTDVLTDLSDDEVAQIIMPPLPKETYLEDLRKVTEDQTDDTLSEILVGRSRETMAWLRKNGLRFIPMFGRQSYKVGDKQHFYGGVNIETVGGGWGLVDMLITRALKVGVEIRYATPMRALLQSQSGAIRGVKVQGPAGFEEIEAKAVVLACGGFEANQEMRVRYLGPGWESCRVRGTRHNTGEGIRRRSISARWRSAAGRRAMRCSGTSARRRSAIAWCSTTSRSTRIRSASSSISKASASSTKAPTSAITRTRNMAAK